MLLAINKDVTLESTYDEVGFSIMLLTLRIIISIKFQAVALLKRAEGMVTLVLLTLKSEDSLRAEKEAEEKRQAGNVSTLY